MTTNYLGSGNTIYTFDDGKAIELSQEQLKELATQNKFYIAMKEDSLMLIKQNEKLENKLNHRDLRIDDLEEDIELYKKTIYDLETKLSKIRNNKRRQNEL